MTPSIKDWVTARLGRLAIILRRSPGYQRQAFVYEGQRYMIEGYLSPGDHIMTISPLPALKGSRTDYWPLRSVGLDPGMPPECEARISNCRAHVDFKILTESYGRFCGIEVPEQFQRQGVGRKMVLALFSQYPGIMFHNTALNAKSRPFFKALQEDFPENLAPISDN